LQRLQNLPVITAQRLATEQRTDVDNKLAIDAVFGKNVEAFPESDDEDESCDSDGDTEHGDSDDGSDGSLLSYVPDYVLYLW
jgi:hypothetical protein